MPLHRRDIERRLTPAIRFDESRFVFSLLANQFYQIAPRIDLFSVNLPLEWI
eukprot:COSAG06_NODE_1535_length_9155_cov_68.266343_7_plen_52_part_00